MDFDGLDACQPVCARGPDVQEKDGLALLECVLDQPVVKRKP